MECGNQEESFFCVRLELTELTQKLETLGKLKCNLTNIKQKIGCWNTFMTQETIIIVYSLQTNNANLGFVIFFIYASV